MTDSRRRVRCCLACVLVSALAAGCTAVPRLGPVAPLRAVPAEGGASQREFDFDGDGRADMVEALGSSGRLEALRIRPGAAAHGSALISWPPSALGAEAPVRHLLIIADSIPFEIVQEAYAQGRFRAFHRPSRIISPFPVMTDPCLTEFFGVSPCPAVESAYYDGTRLVTGPETYTAEVNAPWRGRVDYALAVSGHTFAYLFPQKWLLHSLAQLQGAFERSCTNDFTAYLVSTSATGSKRGRDGHIEALITLERFCQQLIYDTKGRIQITLMSDHGHDCHAARRLTLGEHLKRAGYNVGTRVRSERDLVIPEWGLVSCAAIYANSPAVAHDVVLLDGIELATFCDADDSVVVLDRDGLAKIRRRDGAFRYETLRGDPLRLAGIKADLATKGKLSADGYASADDWFRATINHEYPDAPARLWRAFHGLFKYQPTVLVSLARGTCHGSADLWKYLKMQAVHGGLSRESSSGVVLSTLGELPAVVRMNQLREMLVQLRGRASKSESELRESAEVRSGEARLTGSVDRAVDSPAPAAGKAGRLMPSATSAPR